MRLQNLSISSLWFSLIIIFVSATGAADLSIGALQASGTGCSGDSVIANAAPDGSAITILFDNYNTEVGINGEPLAATLSCNLLVPVTSSTPVQVSIISADYRGFVALDKGGSAKFHSREAISTDFRDEEDGDEREQEFQGPVNTDFLISAQRPQRHWTACGTAFQFIAASDLTVQSPLVGSQALISIDSLDVAVGSGIRLSFITQTCSPQHDGGDGQNGNHDGNGGGDGSHGNNKGDGSDQQHEDTQQKNSSDSGGPTRH